MSLTSSQDMKFYDLDEKRNSKSAFELDTSKRIKRGEENLDTAASSCK
jgi:hypothetical protein